MVGAAQNLSVHQQQRLQRRERLVWVGGLGVAAAACAAVLVLFPDPLPLALGVAGVLGAAAIALNPRIGLYVLLVSAILLEQWGIAGLDPVTGRFPFYQTLAAALGVPLRVSPVELLLLLTLGLMLPRQAARRAGTFVRGPLFVPLLLFLAGVVAAIAFGWAGGRGAGPFDLRAAWEETRSFFYLGITYVLACNLIQTRAHLRIFTWLFILAIGVKSVQGVARFVYIRANGMQVEAITGHEDVVFFAAFVLLLVTLVLFGARLDAAARRQTRLMFLVLPLLALTLLVTNRRLGFVVLAVGLALVALILLRTRRDIFLRLAPLVVVVLSIYTVVFWNNTGVLGQPIRAVRSIVAPATERDRSSNAWRELENRNLSYNISTAPITGLGFGRPYAFAVSQPPLDATGFVYWRYITHNAVYWMWMKMGLIGFILFWNLAGSAVVLGLVTFRRLNDPYLKALALVGAGVVLMQVIFSYGDLGLTYSRSMIFLGCMLGVLVRLPALAEQPAVEDAESTGEQAAPAGLPAAPAPGRSG